MFSFSCSYNQKREKIVVNVKEGIVSRGGSFNGDTERGQFTVGQKLGLFSGHYRFTNSHIEIEFTRKPMYMTKEYIEGEVSAYFERQLIKVVKKPTLEAA